MLTLLTCLQPGNALSRAKAQINRDVVATNAITPMPTISTMMMIIPVAPPREVLVMKMSKKGSPICPVGLSRAESMSVVTKRTAMIMAKPSVPFSSVVPTMDQGTTTSAFLTSSAIYEAVSLHDQLCISATYVYSTITTYVVCQPVPNSEKEVKPTEHREYTSDDPNEE